jgi:hypothetical protein
MMELARRVGIDLPHTMLAPLSEIADLPQTSLASAAMLL